MLARSTLRALPIMFLANIGTRVFLASSNALLLATDSFFALPINFEVVVRFPL